MLSAVLLLAFAAAAATLAVSRRLRRVLHWWVALAGQRTESELAAQFVFIPASCLLGMSILLAATAGSLGLMLGGPWPLVITLIVAALAAPRLAIRWLRQRWRVRMARQLPDALSLWAGLLRAGQSSQQALAQVAQRQQSPLGDELRLVLGQLRVGIALEAAFSALRERSGLADLRMLATLLATQRDLGGNLAESLQRLAELLRGRLQMEARIEALTSQGRMQGLVVGLLPILLLLVLYAMEREAMQVLHTSWPGWIALAAIAALEATGFVLIRRIVRIQV